MAPSRFAVVSLALLSLVLLSLALPSPGSLARASDAEAPGPYGDSYTTAEIAAIDRALHAVNMDRRDLRFRKDMGEGHGAFPVVKAMLDDPLLIAPVMDGMAARLAVRNLGPIDQTTAAVIVGADPFAPHAAARDALAEDLAARASGDGAKEGGNGDLAALLVRIASAQPRIRLTASVKGDDDEALLRRVLCAKLPAMCGDHEVYPSPFSADENAAIEAHLKGKPDAYLHELAARLDVPSLAKAWSETFIPALRRLLATPRDAFPTDRPRVQETPFGRVALGTPGDDVYAGDYAVLVDPGGDDRYTGCRIGAASGVAGRGVGFFLDLEGNDLYECAGTDLTLGAAVLGIAAFLDLGRGNDRYEAGHGTLGAAAGGVAVFYDDGGSDSYDGKTFTQGAAGFGIGAFLDDALQEPPEVTSDEGTPDPVRIDRFDNDRLTAWANAQAFSRPRGVAICWNRRGNEVYQSGGVYLHAPLFADRYQGFSQGFSIGSRGIDWAGGIALLVDREGNDRYLGDVYNQGVGYWYAAGFLVDQAGNDLYEMTQYGQGSGIHLAVGGVVDGGGNDTYVMHSGLGQGGSHDYAASILHDRGGDDRYHGATACNGCGLTNSVGIHIDRAGNDTYAGRRDGGVNTGRPARGFGSVGLLADLAGADDYLGVMANGDTWRHTDVGAGVDVPDPEVAAAPAAAPATGPGRATAKLPDVVGYRGDLTQEVFDELWAIAVRWEVGDNRAIVPEARKRLIAFGAPLLPFLDGKVEQDQSGLELRAFVDVLQGLSAGGAEKGVLEFLRAAATSESLRRRRVGLYLIGELKAKDLEQVVARVVEAADEALARRAAGVLLLIGSHAADGRLKGWLTKDADERNVAAALAVLLGLGGDVYRDARALLDHPLTSVRSRLATLLSEKGSVYGAAVREDLEASDLSDRARRTLLEAVARGGIAPDALTVGALVRLLNHVDWGMRADAARTIRALSEAKDADRALLAPALAALDRRLATEEDPFVRFAGRR